MTTNDWNEEKYLKGLIESLNSRAIVSENIVKRLQAIIRIHQGRNWWHRLRNKQITADDVDQELELTERRYELLKSSLNAKPNKDDAKTSGIT